MNPVVIRNVKIGEGMPKICVPIVGVTEKEIVETARQIHDTPADLVEWRVDWFEGAFETQRVKLVLLQIRAILGDMPILFTFRTKKEGGEKSITPEAYRNLLSEMFCYLYDVIHYTFGILEYICVKSLKEHLNSAL